MLDDSKVNLFLSLMAYSQGAWDVDATIKAYEYLASVAKAVPEGKVRMLKAVEPDNGPEIH
jgi:hypothetical protein